MRKNFFVALLIAIFLYAVSFLGCSTSIDDNEQEENTSEFVETDNARYGFGRDKGTVGHIHR